MPHTPSPPPPRNFFLNEQHEFARGEKPSVGGPLKLAPIDWAARSRRLHKTLSTTRAKIANSRDPLKATRYFLAAIPTPVIKKKSDDVRRAPEGVRDEPTEYSGEHSRVFRRLGLDLLAVDDQGRALIHAPATRMDQLLSKVDALPSEGPKEQSRWVTIDSFNIVPSEFRIDAAWLAELPKDKPVDAVLELQPLLSRTEVEQVIRAVLALLSQSGLHERFTRMGTDFSGRHWYRGPLSYDSLRLIADTFYSVQSLHPPLQTRVAAATRRHGIHVQSLTSGAVDVATLPCVAVVDTGIPAGHAQLGPYRRGTFMNPQGPGGPMGDHGSFVASRAVFGDLDLANGIRSVKGDCSFLDVNIADTVRTIDDKSVYPAMLAIAGTYPDVRVFNLSFGEYVALSTHTPVKRREKLLLLQDLDNFIFAQDVIVVVAAGNSPPGLVPNPNYPDHEDVDEWALGSWACGFNTLTCGSFVERLGPGGLVTSAGWPSPFTRIGPGLCKSPVPDFAANGGNCTPQYQGAAGLGVWGTTATAVWEDRSGTSFAAPLLAREAALALSELQKYCEQGARPFAATVKAFLVLTSVPPATLPSRIRSLVRRTLGRGLASATRLHAPSADSVVMLWQGVLNAPDDLARIKLPIPREWLRTAGHPTLRLVGVWESPVNEAAEVIWASRKVEAQLRTAPMGDALMPSNRSSHASYPILDRRYDLSVASLKKRNISAPNDDFWSLEIYYKQIAEYAATIDISQNQRVGVAIELRDESDEPESPQAAMQALRQAVTMIRLSIPENQIPNPVIVRPRIPT